MYSERPSVLDGGIVWTRTSTTPARVVPDGCMDLIWMGDSLVVAGPDTSAHMADAAPSGVFTGLRFPPGGAPSFLGVAAHELRDRRVPLDDVWSSADVRRLEERMAEAVRPDLVLESLAVGRLGGTRHPE